MGPQGSGFALMAAHHRVDILGPHAVDVADPHGGQRAALDPVADRLGGQLELASDLLDGEELPVGHRSPRRGMERMNER